MPGKKRSRCDDVTAHQLTPNEIKVKSLKFLNKSRVPYDAVVFKELNKHYVIHNGMKTQVFTSDTLSQKRYQYYSRQDIPANATVLGMGTKHNKNYVIEDGKRIAVFSRCNLSKFHLALKDGQAIDPQTTVYLDEPNMLYIEDDAQKKFVSQVRKIPYVIHNGMKTQVFTSDTLSQKRYQYYSGQDIPANATVLGMGTKHNKSYVIEDGKKIPVFSRRNLSTFYLALKDGQAIDPQTTVYLDKPDILYIEDDAQKKFVSQVRKIPCNRQEVSSVKESSIPTPDGISGPQPISPGALGMFAANRRSPQVPNRTVPMDPMSPISPEKHVSLVDFDSSVFDISLFDSGNIFCV